MKRIYLSKWIALPAENKSALLQFLDDNNVAAVGGYHFNPAVSPETGRPLQALAVDVITAEQAVFDWIDVNKPAGIYRIPKMDIQSGTLYASSRSAIVDLLTAAGHTVDVSAYTSAIELIQAMVKLVSDKNSFIFDTGDFAA